MLRMYYREADCLFLRDPDSPDTKGSSHLVAWYDLFNPTADEDNRVEAELKLAVPTRAEMDEIEPSARLYQEDGAEFMTLTILTNLDREEPVKSPVSFILKGWYAGNRSLQ